MGLIAFKWSAVDDAGSMPAYDDGTTPTLVTEKPPAIVLKVRGGSDTYVKQDGSTGTAGKGALMSEEVAFTVAATQDQTLFAPTCYAIQGDGGTSSGNQHGCGVSGGDVSYTLNTTDRHSVAVDFRHAEVGGEADATQTLQAKSTGGYSLNYMPGATDGYVVRRLTPRECERLQGMPDDHTRVPYRGKPAEECPDGPRYKAIGNSMAVPVMRWIGERIAEVDALMGGGDERGQT